MKVLSLLYPPRCIFCGAKLGRNAEKIHICGDCQKSLPYIWKQKPVQDVVAPWHYRDAVRAAIRRFKFTGAVSYARTFGWVMAQCVNSGDFDAVTWVPCSFLRRLKRRFDQSRLLAKEVALVLDKPLLRLLRRERHGKPQFRQADARQRRENVRGAFAARSKAAAGMRVLLVDDIYTTGATFEECRRMLKTAGAVSVTMLCVARARQKVHSSSRNY